MPQDRHQLEIERNRAAWHRKPLLREVYDGFYRRILARLDPTVPGAVVELGGGIGHLKRYLPRAICTDLFPNPWVDLVCDAYRMPFSDHSVACLVLFDVFHHLRAPGAFLREARRVLAPGGKVLLFEPYISVASYPVYAWLHPEPVAMREPIEPGLDPPEGRAGYYAAQGNATRLFFRHEAAGILAGWRLEWAEAFSAFAYLLCGGYSKPALYSRALRPWLDRCDRALSRFPRWFAARCLVELRPPWQ